MKKNILSWFAYISLTIAFIVGYVISKDSDALRDLHLITENSLVMDNAEHGVYKLYKDSKLYGYLALGDSQGYGGPMKCAVLSDIQGNLIGTEILKDFETPAFVNKLNSKGYYKQYVGKSVGDKFALNEDVQAISGATVSSNAVADASREAAHKIAEEILVPVQEFVVDWNVPVKEAIVLLIFLSGTFAILYSKKRLCYFTQFLSIIFIGVLLNASLTLTHFGRIILGYFPDIHTHLSWWILVSGTILVIIVFGKNVYCSALCPFRATQVLLNKLSGINLKIPASISKLMSKTPMFLLWLSLMIIFISANPTLSSYEPFAILFSLKAYGVQWYILPASLIGALFLSNFFCRFFCPVGGILFWIVKKRNQLIKLINIRN